MKKCLGLSVAWVALLSAVFVTGCGKAPDGPSAVEPAAVPAIDIATLPEFLRYPGAVATERMELSLPDGKGAVWTMVTSDPVNTVGDWYRASVDKAGWVKLPEMHAGQSTMLEWEKRDKRETIKIMVYVKDGRTGISITHGLKRADAPATG